MFAKVADSLLSRVAPTVTASAQTYTECTCVPFPFTVHCGLGYDRKCRTCGESWCGSYKFVGCC